MRPLVPAQESVTADGNKIRAKQTHSKKKENVTRKSASCVRSVRVNPVSPEQEDEAYSRMSCLLLSVADM